MSEKKKVVESVPAPVVEKDQKVYLANLGKFKLLDNDLKLRLESIGNLATEFEICLALVQHEANEFG